MLTQTWSGSKKQQLKSSRRLLWWELKVSAEISIFKSLIMIIVGTHRWWQRAKSVCIELDTVSSIRTLTDNNSELENGVCDCYFVKALAWLTMTTFFILILFFLYFYISVFLYLIDTNLCFSWMNKLLDFYFFSKTIIFSSHWSTTHRKNNSQHFY